MPPPTLTAIVPLPQHRVASEPCHDIPAAVAVWLSGEAAADGFRLAIQPLPNRHPHLEWQRVLLPAHAVKVLGHLWRHAAGPPSDEGGDFGQVVIGKRLLRLEYDDKLARFTVARVTLTFHQVQGTFPNHRPLVPEAPDAVCSFLGEDMSQAVEML